MDKVASVWLEDFKRVGLTDSDSERVAYAFRSIGPTVTRFPAPKQVISMIPRRENPKAIEHQLSEEQCRENLKRLHSMMAEAGLA